jgi:hypothetical protein
MVFLLPWCFWQAQEHASSQIGPVDVFQRVGASRQRAGSQHTTEVMRGLPRKSVGIRRARGAFVGALSHVAQIPAIGRLVETPAKLDRLPSALCNQVASSKILGVFCF